MPRSQQNPTTFLQQPVNMMKDDSEQINTALKAYQVENMKLKDELMQVRVDSYDVNQKILRIQSEAQDALS